MRYQSFNPNAISGSDSFSKLQQLRLPDLFNKSVLDIGCNEGFFCGYAKSQGASRVLGIDFNLDFIASAKKNFPDCDFEVRDFSKLPDEKFDMILLASTLHYSNSPEELLAGIFKILKPGGLFVLEAGVHPSKETDWIKVERSIDTRAFPTMSLMFQLITPYNGRLIGESVPQTGDPIPRYVFHLSKPKPLALLALGEGFIGKTTLSTKLSRNSELVHLSSDELFTEIWSGNNDYDSVLTRIVRQNNDIPYLYQLIYASGLAKILATSLLKKSKSDRDVVLDLFSPSQYHQEIETAVIDAGYMPVRLNWKVNQLTSPTDSLSRATAYKEILREQMNEGSQETSGVLSQANSSKLRYQIDNFFVETHNIRLIGWCFNSAGLGVNTFTITIKGIPVKILAKRRIIRPDVQEALKISSKTTGFEVLVEKISDDFQINEIEIQLPS